MVTDRRRAMMQVFPFARTTLTLVLSLCCVSAAQGQSRQEGFLVAYETLEMAMNEFRNFAGEVGYRLDPKYQVRLTIMEVDLTERHLASQWESAAVDGKNVEGYFRGYEAHVDRFFAASWYVSGAIGYYKDQYAHTQLDESLENRTLTVGSGIGYSRANLFGIRGLYFNFDSPVRYYFNPIKERKWGETTIRPHVVISNIWLFAGIKF